MLQLLARFADTSNYHGRAKTSLVERNSWPHWRAKETYGLGDSPTAKTSAGHHKVGFEDVLYIIKQYKCRSALSAKMWLLNTLPVHQQTCLIPFTVPCLAEEDMVNGVINDLSKNPHDYVIVIYGKNNTDDTMDSKFKQLIKLGFTNVFIYYGGLFEWTLLQDVYGSDHFPVETTDSRSHDPLQWAPPSKFAMG